MPQDRTHRAGGSIEDYCRACKTDRTHTVIAVDEAGSRGVAGSGGFGMKFFLNDWLGLRLDVRDQVRSVRGPLGVERTVNDISALGGLSVFIPFSS